MNELRPDPFRVDPVALLHGLAGAGVRLVSTGEALGMAERLPEICEALARAAGWDDATRQAMHTAFAKEGLDGIRGMSGAGPSLAMAADAILATIYQNVMPRLLGTDDRRD